MSEWQPIETAPPNTPGLVWVNHHSNDYRNIAFGELRVWIGPEYEGGKYQYPKAEGYSGDWEITHWMPLPKAPEQ